MKKTLMIYEELFYQDALTVLLATISSTPVELQEAVLDTLYYAEAGQEPFLEKGTTIGDCQIRADIGVCSTNLQRFTFGIKPR